MTTQTNTQTEIKLTAEIIRAINKVMYYDAERFISDANRYIKAIEEGRMLCSIVSVSSSGMSRVLKFASMEQFEGENRYALCNYFCLFLSLGYKENSNREGFKIGGCGMDMVFNTNYNIIHDFHRIGLITKEQCNKLAQKTPQCF